jgi:hypothetical protein
MQLDALTELAKQLYDLRHTGQLVPFVSVGIGDGSQPDDWRPAQHDCFNNTRTWVTNTQGYSAVYGWVMFRHPLIHFAAHAVILRPDGRLMDITPSGASQSYPFIRHPGSDEEFRQVASQFDPDQPVCISP